MKRVLLTGGTGFVGANLARRLLGAGHEVHLLVRTTHDPWRIADIAGDVRLQQADICDREQVAAALRRSSPDWVFHLAAYGAYPFQTDLALALRTNVLGTATLLEACVERGFDAFVNTGSSSEYGFKGHAPTENEVLQPNSAYAVSKASATLYCRWAAERDGVPVVTLRLYSVYGPYEEPTRLLPTLLVFGLEHRLPPLAQPEVARDFVYVDDVCDAYLRAAHQCRAGHTLYNVATGVQTSLGEVVAVARRLLGISAEPAWGSLPNRPHDTSVWVGDPSRIRKELGWSPTRAFPDGFRETAEWLRGDARLLALYRERSTRQTA